MGVEQRGVREGASRKERASTCSYAATACRCAPPAGTPRGRRGPVADDGRVVAGLDGVVQDAGQVGAGPASSAAATRVAVEPPVTGSDPPRPGGPARGGTRRRRGDLEHTDALGLDRGGRPGRACAAASARPAWGRPPGAPRPPARRGSTGARGPGRRRRRCGGTGSSGEARASVTKNGLPAVAWCSRCASTGGRRELRDRVRGERAQRQPRTTWPPRLPRTPCSGCSRRARRAGRSGAAARAGRRPAGRRAAAGRGWRSSAQCTSSTASTVGFGAASSSRTAGNTSPRSSAARAAESGPRACRTASRSGPSARGVSRSSQAPASTRPVRRERVNARTRLVLPMPASPETAAIRPAPPSAASRAECRAANAGPRSSSSTRRC